MGGSSPDGYDAERGSEHHSESMVCGSPFQLPKAPIQRCYTTDVQVLPERNGMLYLGSSGMEQRDFHAKRQDGGLFDSDSGFYPSAKQQTIKSISVITTSDGTFSSSNQNSSGSQSPGAASKDP